MKAFCKRPMWIFLILCLAAILIWTLWGNTALMVSRHTLSSSNIPKAFDGYRIAHISDLHNAEFGTDNARLLTLLENAQPDLIAITGDLIDSRKTDIETAIAFVEKAMQIAPVCYVPGNHEARIPAAYRLLKASLSELGVAVLENESVPLQNGTDTVTLTGLLDPDFGMPWPECRADTYHIVLSHRPERFDWYAQQGCDLVFTGHAHGGQFRLPWIGGLVAPNQGLFPRYDAGLYRSGSTAMVVSRGLGNSVFPLRFNNRPELILVTLESI